MELLAQVRYPTGVRLRSWTFFLAVLLAFALGFIVARLTS